jgi:crossover junction endodeoxyribonuclease RuvC
VAVAADPGIRILGLDPGSRHTGFGLIVRCSGRLTYLDSGTLSPGAAADLPRRLASLHDLTCRLLERAQPDVVAIEDIFSAVNPRTALTLAHARGVLVLAVVQAGLPVLSYPPATVKKAVVGAGAAAKDKVAWMVERLLEGLPAGGRHGGHDATDALAVALCHAAHLRTATVAGAGRVTHAPVGGSAGTGRPEGNP